MNRRTLIFNVPDLLLDCAELAFNKILRRIWRLPPRTHTRILHAVAGLSSICNVILSRSNSLSYSASVCSSFVVHSIFHEALYLSYSFVGFNFNFSFCYFKSYSCCDIVTARWIRDYVYHTQVFVMTILYNI